MHHARSIRSQSPVRCVVLLFLALPLAVSLVTAQSPKSPLNPLPTLTTIRQVHSLSAAEAARSYPVHLRAVVTYFDSYIDPRHMSLFIHDSTAGIFVLLPPGLNWPDGPPSSGTTVEISGISKPGEFASVVSSSDVRVLSRKSALPTARPVNLRQMLSGVEDCEWVEVEGIVQSVFQSATNVTLEIALAEGTIGATTIKLPGVDYSALIDSKIRLRGTVAATFNASRQMTGARIYFPDMSAVAIEEPAPADPFSTPVRLIDSLSRFTPLASASHRVHVRGVVTLHWPGGDLCFQDATQGICAQSSQDTNLQVGELVDVLGYVTLGGYRPTLVDAVFKPMGAGKPIAPSVVTASQALRGDHDAELVQIEGRLIGNQTTTDNPTLVFSADGFVFPVSLPPGSNLAKLHNGSVLRLTDVCSVQIDHQRTVRGFGSAITKSFSIILQSPADMTVLRTPSFWTSSRILLLLIVVLVIAAAALGWVIVLRRRVEQQTQTIRESEERFRHLAQHDALTGLPTRVLLHDRLEIALERARRLNTGVALFMLDLDNFKQVNDSFGHGCGDQTLQIAARRISSRIRKSDTVARLGGDEFVIVVSDLAKPDDAELIASQIVDAFAPSMEIGNHRVTISVSIGVCTIFDGSIDATNLLKCADYALYAAKAQGRNCFRIVTSDAPPTAPDKFQSQTSPFTPITGQI